MSLDDWNEEEPTDRELDELERSGLDLIEDPNFSPVSDRVDELIETQNEILIKIEKMEKMLEFVFNAFKNSGAGK